jgi:hypothetical protein
VQEHAENGSPETDIVLAMGITEEQLRDPQVAQRLRDIVTRGNAKKRLLVRARVGARGRKTGKGAGSVNALALEARNLLEWDRQQQTQEEPPDLTSALPRLKLTLERIAAGQSDIQGRMVTAAEVLCMDVLTAPDEVKH